MANYAWLDLTKMDKLLANCHQSDIWLINPAYLSLLAPFIYLIRHSFSWTHLLK